MEGKEMSDLAIDESGILFKVSVDGGQNTGNFLNSISFTSRDGGSVSSRGVNS